MMKKSMLFWLCAVLLMTTGNLFAAQDVPNFSAKEVVSGKTIKLSDYKGKPVLFVMWATWCGPCVREVPELIKVQKRLKGKVTVLAMSYDNSKSTVKRFAKRKGINYPVIMGSGVNTGPMQSQYIPALFLINKNGKFVKKLNLRHADDIIKALKPYMSTKIVDTLKPVIGKDIYDNSLDFSQKDIMTGKTISLSKYKGKVVVLNFWATWCPPCRAEIPDLIKLHKNYKGKVVVIGASVDRSGTDVVQNYYRNNGLNYPMIMGNAIRSKYPSFSGIPTTFIIDTRGKIVKRITGSRSYSRFEKAVKPYILKDDPDVKKDDTEDEPALPEGM